MEKDDAEDDAGDDEKDGKAAGLPETSEDDVD